VERIKTTLPSNRNLDVVTSALYDLYRHREIGTLPVRIAEVVSRAVTCDSAIYVHIDPRARSFNLTCWPGGSLGELDRRDAYLLHRDEHPLVEHYRGARDARAWSLYDFVDPQAFRKTRLYGTIYQPLGIEYQLAMLLPDPGTSIHAVAVHRRNRDFSEEERHVLESFWPHLIQASRNARALRRSRDVGALQSLVEGRGIVVLDRNCSVELCTEQARVWLASYFPEDISRRKLQLPERVANWVADQLADVSPARGTPDNNRLEPLILSRGENFLSIRLIADQGRGQHLLIIEEESLNAPPLALEGLGLTQRESEVLTWVAQGKSNPEVAIILGMSARTVQKHLEHVFDKLGVESRTAAILRAWHCGRYALLGPR
jgi:DNA-binding CsgD family transcriptional regulator